MLADVVGGPELERRHGKLRRAGAGDHDDRERATGRPQRAHDAQPFGVGQAEIGHHAGDRRVGEGRERRAQPIGERHPHRRLHVRERVPHGCRMLRIVLDEKDMQSRNRLMSIHHILPPSFPVAPAWTAPEQCESTTRRVNVVPVSIPPFPAAGACPPGRHGVGADACGPRGASLRRRSGCMRELQHRSGERRLAARAPGGGMTHGARRAAQLERVGLDDGQGRRLLTALHRARARDATPLRTADQHDSWRRPESALSSASMRLGFARLAAAVSVLTLSANAGAQIPSPTIEGPIMGPGDPFVASTGFDLAQVGYEQAEYFISGTASAYTSTAPLGADGMWSAARNGATAAYKTRLLVYRPTNPKKFNGTVIVEWLNVSGGLDAAPDWSAGHVELLREGCAYVGASAQIVGVEGGTALVGIVSLPLKTVNPARYGTLSHPGDSFSYDIYSQAGQAIRQPSGPSPLGDLKVKRVIAIGESQSAFRMVTYINAIHPTAHIYDGFLVHSRGGAFGARLSEGPQTIIDTPAATHIRGDVDVPVLTFQTETDLTLLGFFVARQDDAKNFRLWEVAGTAHADSYSLSVGNSD